MGITQGRVPRFVKNYMDDGGTVLDACSAFVREVKDRSYPAAEHCFS
ncbi:MAG: 3-methyl-2-oxobutanoate hydroxymethyltransferase [Gammaproteobacteria bacterium]